MALDGIFIHYLVAELNETILYGKINKISQPNPFDLVFQINSKNSQGIYRNNYLLISGSLDAPRLYLTKYKLDNPKIPNNFCMVLRKYLERGVVREIKQIANDRIIVLIISGFTELGDEQNYYLMIELMGRNTNIILVNSQMVIIDALRKLPPSENNYRFIIPRANYAFPLQADLINPFEVDDMMGRYDLLQGVCQATKNELHDQQIRFFSDFLKRKVQPTATIMAKKTDLYCFDLQTLTGEKSYFESLSEMMDWYYNHIKKTTAFENQLLQKKVKRFLAHFNHKIGNLYDDLAKAEVNTKYHNIGIVLQANLYQVKKGMREITLSNFLEDGTPLVIELDERLEPAVNLERIFKLAKKAKTALVKVREQIDLTKAEIAYLENIIVQLDFASSDDLNEIITELTDNNYLKKTKNKSKKRNKITINKITVDNIDIYIGKNNWQNDYLTNKMAANNDYWFHVQNAPGAHVVVSVPGNQADFCLTEKIIRQAANAAAYFSKYSTSSSVPVDYTKVKHLKKIPGMKGFNLTYTNQKTIYIDPEALDS